MPPDSAKRQILFVFIGLGFLVCLTAAQSPMDSKSVPEWLPFSIPPELYAKWRKFGPWDYKAQALKYREATHFNFGATGHAAGLDKDKLLALARAAMPTSEDLSRIEDSKLEAKFDQQRDGIQRLQAMAVQDGHVIRIAPDFTWLDTDSAWPRSDIGIPDSRWNEYRSLFRKLSLPEGIVRTEDFPGAIFFVARAKGLCIGGTSAGYAYSATELSPLVQAPGEALNSERRRNPDRHYAYAFERIQIRNWYTFYEMDW